MGGGEVVRGCEGGDVMVRSEDDSHPTVSALLSLLPPSQPRCLGFRVAVCSSSSLPSPPRSIARSLSRRLLHFGCCSCPPVAVNRAGRRCGTVGGGRVGQFGSEAPRNTFGPAAPRLLTRRADWAKAGDEKSRASEAREARGRGVERKWAPRHRHRHTRRQGKRLPPIGGPPWLGQAWLAGGWH